ncbi:T surface-antigen of pili [Isoptericola dokdonensis DS-3]|uniref:T surface-antigen of pili n=1 Tax=Isoptericola dokdonensis DS-3 TaxID=1300344 RepID=A0A161IJF7_9MICO|nr:T surface-antigen of pili [Isoptericola dokdonensis DS-3]
MRSTATGARPPGRRSRTGGTLAVAALAAVLAAAGVVVAPGQPPAAQAAPADLLPPASGILPGPAPGGATPGAWGPCVPDPAADDSCAGWLVPPGAILESFPGTDDAPNVVVGGDFTAGLGSAETEGLLVVAGDADFLKGYNVGVAGGGTGVVPAHRADMLIVGGDATVANPSEDPNAAGNPATVGVGLTTSDGSNRYGTIHVGGARNFRDPSFGAADTTYGVLGNIDTANQEPPATETQNVLDGDVSVLVDDGYTELFGAEGKMARYSQQCYAELSTETEATTILNEGGSLSLEHGTFAQSGDVVTLTSTGSADVVEFVLPATLGTVANPVQINIVGATTAQTVLVNTLAAGTVTHFIGDVYWGAGVGDELNTRALVEGRHLLWNYPFTTDLVLGGATQFPGSVLVGDPGSVTQIGFSGANGRIYTPGDLVHSGTATATSGSELHGYPFDGALGCIREIPGTFFVTKEITGDGADAVPPDVTFTVAWEVTGPADSPNLGRTGTVEVLADGTPALGPDDLAEGDVVTFAEPTVPTVDGVVWGAPQIQPNPLTVAGDTAATVTVTNEAVLVRGGFTIRKEVTGDPGGTTDEFTGTWTCDAEDVDGDDSGTWTLADGEEATVDGLPVGTTCTVAEDPVTDANGTWTTSIDPDTVVVAEGDASATVVTVTNEFTSTVGAFTIAKEVTGDDGATLTEFTVAWTCTAPDGSVTSGTATVAAGTSSDPVGGLPVGTLCTVEEAVPDDPNGTWTAEVTPSEIVIASDDPADVGVVTVTNTFTVDRGGFTIRKEVTGDPGGTTDEFTGTWTCDAQDLDGDDSGTWTLVDGDEATVDGLPVGTTCTVAEDPVTDANGTWTTSIDPDTVVVTDGDVAATIVTVTNDFTVSPTPSPSAPTPTASPSTAAPTPVAPTEGPTSPAPTAGPDLPRTGADVGGWAMLALTLVGLGTVAVLAVRRRA